MPDARSNAEQAAFVAGLLEAASLCGLEYVSEDETNGFLCDEDQSHNIGVANCVDAIRAAAFESMPEGYVLVPIGILQQAHSYVERYEEEGELTSAIAELLAAVKP